MFRNLCVVFAALPALIAIADDLPSESELPRPVVAQPSQLPSESDLPPALAARQASDPSTGQPEKLPDESQLPPAEAEPVVDPPGPLPLDGSPDGIPWLRLNPGGHTAPIRAIKFTVNGNRLCTAGDDKAAITWSRPPGGARWRYERTIRWQVQRGRRGRIYTLASTDDLLAIAGDGAMVGIGEVILVDPASGDYRATLFDEANGHRQVVVAMDARETADGLVFATLSMDGRALLWKQNEQGIWQAAVARPDDATAGAAKPLAGQLLAARGFSGIAAIDARRVVVPQYAETRNNVLGWRLQIVDARDQSTTKLGGNRAPLHWQSVTAIAVDAQRKRLVSADGEGNVYLWDLTKEPAVVARLQRSKPLFVLDLALSDDGSTLAIGTTVDPATSKSLVEVWDVSTLSRPKLRTTLLSTAHVLACDVGPAGESVAYAAGQSLIVRNVAAGGPEALLSGSSAAPMLVAFAREEPYYRVGIGTKPAENGGSPLDHVFDTDRLQLTRGAEFDNKDWLPTNWGQGNWTVTEATAANRERQWWLAEDGQRRARLPLSEAQTGVFRTACWFPAAAADSPPPMVVVGTSSGEILICRVANEGESSVVRRLRGHASEIRSLGLSRDLQWLVSASADATVRIWPVAEIAAATNSQNRWGAEFKVDDEGRLLIAEIDPGGPLFFRSARSGDEVVGCKWSVGDAEFAETDATKLKRILDEVSWDQVMEFELRTGRQPTREFQLVPAWQQIVSLVIDDEGEWAYWAPSGFYDASFEGHRLFGWQINRGLDELPDYFLATQFRAVLEKPDVMSRLLRAGSLDAAFQAAQLQGPADASQTVVHAYRLKPEVTIVEPAADSRLEAGDRPVVRARIHVPAGQRLAPPKAFANAVVAPPGRLVNRTTDERGEILEYEWNLAVPSDPNVLVQVVAATETEVTDSDELVLANDATDSQSKPRLIWLSASVDDYRDAQIPDLRTPVTHASRLLEVIRGRSGPLYDVESALLTNDAATRPAWAAMTDHFAAGLRASVSPDDLLVIYISGHGVQDLAGNAFYFVTADAEFAEVMSGSYGDCLAFDDFARFADISCRKLVILDTCHSGAIQPMRHREIKAAVRALQQDQILTLAASHGSQEAVEGRFSSRLIEALKGNADRTGGNQDGVVGFDELVAYIKQTVADDSLGDEQVQTPSAGPANLLPYVTLSLTSVDQRESVGGRPLRRAEAEQPDSEEVEPRRR